MRQRSSRRNDRHTKQTRGNAMRSFGLSAAARSVVRAGVVASIAASLVSFVVAALIVASPARAASIIRHGHRAGRRAAARRVRAGAPRQAQDDRERAHRQCRPLRGGEPAGGRISPERARARRQGRAQERHRARGRRHRGARLRAAERAGALERSDDPAGPAAPAGGARQADPVRQLPELPRLPVEDGGGHHRRGRLAHARRVHARGDALLARRPRRLQRRPGRRGRVLSQPRVRGSLGAAEIADRARGLSRHHGEGRRRGAQHRLCRFRNARAQSFPLDRASRQRRQFLDPAIRGVEPDRALQSCERRDQGVSRPASRPGADPFRGAGA